MSREHEPDGPLMAHVASRRLMPKDRDELLKRLRSEVNHARVDGSAVDELIAERRAEARREDIEREAARRA
jgi:hypothetical protein